LAATKSGRKVKKRIPPNYCFVCGKDNPDGLHLHFEFDPKRKSVECRLKLPARYQGATGFAHGGIIATLLDEAMAKVNGLQGVRAVTLTLRASYRKVVPVEKPLLLRGWHTARRGRKIYLRAQLLDSNHNLLAEGRGLFLQITGELH
jgi:acyl-coenzyme A thioesterase PaaI-like protein